MAIMIHDPLAASLQAGIAAELRHVHAALEQLAEVLVSDVHFASSYLDQLQAFDFLGQCAHESAAVLDRLAGGSDPLAAVAPVRLGVVQARLHAAMTLAKAA